MLTRENVHITNLLISGDSQSMSVIDRLDSILRDESFANTPPTSLQTAWRNFDTISQLIETGSEEILAEFFACKNAHSLTTLAGEILTMTRNDPELLIAARVLMSRLSDLANSLNRLHEARIMASKFADVFMLFRFVDILGSKIRNRMHMFLMCLTRRVTGGTSKILAGKIAPPAVPLPPVVSSYPGKIGPGKAPPPIPNTTEICTQNISKISPKMTPPPLSTFSSGKSVPSKAPPIPPPLIPGKMTSPVIPPKAPAGLPGSKPKIPGPSSVAEIFTAPVFPVPRMSAGVEFRKIHWQSIPVSRFEKSIFNQKIFGKQFNQEIDFEIIKKHFVREKNCQTPIKSREPLTAAGTPLIGSSSPGSSFPVCVASVLDQKRIQQIEIFLNRYRNLTREFLESLVRDGESGDESLVDLLEAILALFPSPEETELLKLSNEKSTLESLPMPKADAFSFNLAIAIPEFKLAASSRIIMTTFDASFNDLHDYLKVLNKKIGEIFRSDSLVKIFRIVGSMVTFLSNGGSTNSFNGFGIDNLLSLRKILSFNSKEYSAINCVVEMLSEIDWLDFSTIDDSITGLLEFDFEEVLIEISELEKAVVSRLSKIEFKSRDFYATMTNEIREFISRVTPLLSSLTEEKNRAKINVKNLREYFGENDKKSVNDILIALKSFKNDLANARSRKNRDKHST